MAGSQVADDAVVVEAAPGVNLVQTVDFFTPIVDDPFHYGKIAATNSLSDVFAMGGRPLSAMNICCFPTQKLGHQMLTRILQGGLEAVLEAGAVLAGGHTVEDAEPKYGLAVTGLVDQHQMTTKHGFEAGQKLLLSKPIGTGILTTAFKRGALDEAGLAEAIGWMETSNKAARDQMVEAGCRGATDITGYGLLGHAMECCRPAGVGFVINIDSVPLMTGVRELFQEGYVPGGSRANHSWLESRGLLDWAEPARKELGPLLGDAQTSGGLLIGWPAEKEVPEGLWEIGRVIEGEPGLRLE